MQPPVIRAAQAEAFDYTDPEHEAKKSAVVSLREDRLRQVEAAILATPQGREWVWGILNGDCHLFEKKLALSGKHEQGFLDGQMHVGYGLMRRLAGGLEQQIVFTVE